VGRFREQLRYDSQHLSLPSLPGRDRTAEFPELEPLRHVHHAHRVILDGGLVCLDEDDTPDFGRGPLPPRPPSAL
jgi:ATP-dependent DNA ligase